MKIVREYIKIRPYADWTDKHLEEYEQSLYDREVDGDDTWEIRDEVLWEMNYRKIDKIVEVSDYSDPSLAHEQAEDEKIVKLGLSIRKRLNIRNILNSLRSE